MYIFRVALLEKGGEPFSLVSKILRFIIRRAYFFSFRKSFAGIFWVSCQPLLVKNTMIHPWPLCPRKAPQKKERVIEIYLNKKQLLKGRNSLYRIGSVDKFSWFTELNHAFLQIIQGPCRERKKPITFNIQRILPSLQHENGTVFKVFKLTFHQGLVLLVVVQQMVPQGLLQKSKQRKKK